MTDAELDEFVRAAGAERYGTQRRTDVRLDDVLALVAEVRRLRAEVGRLKAAVREAHQREMVLEGLASPEGFLR